MNGYIIIEDKRQIVNDGTIHKTIEKALEEAFRVKDDWWDCTARTLLKLYIINLKNGKIKKLKGWKSNYTRFDKFGKEETTTHWYNTKQIKTLEEDLK